MAFKALFETVSVIKIVVIGTHNTTLYLSHQTTPFGTHPAVP